MARNNRIFLFTFMGLEDDWGQPCDAGPLPHFRPLGWGYLKALCLHVWHVGWRLGQRGLWGPCASCVASSMEASSELNFWALIPGETPESCLNFNDLASGVTRHPV